MASDHAGFEMKSYLVDFLRAQGTEVDDFGPNSAESVDYPDYAHPLAKAVEEGKYELAIAMCGSGNGINMTLNKHQGIRSALCWTTEIAKLAREHNDANVCTLPARFLSKEEAQQIVNVFLNTAFEGGRHQRRIDKISCS